MQRQSHDIRRGILAAGLMLVSAATAAAQPASGAIVSGAVSAAITNGSSNVAVSGSAGYRMNRGLGFGMELTWIPSAPPDDRILPYASLLAGDLDTELTLFTANVRLEVPTTVKRLLPFVVAGGGIANTTTHFDLRFPQPLIDAGVSLPIYPFYPIDSSATSMVLTLGGGVSLLMGEHLSIDFDLREIHLLGGRGGDIGRFGAGASFRF